MSVQQPSRDGDEQRSDAAVGLERYLALLDVYIVRRVRLLEASGKIRPGSLSVPSLLNQTVLAALQQWSTRTPEQPLSEAPPPDQAIENRRRQDYFCCLLGQLPESWREPLLLRVVDGY